MKRQSIINVTIAATVVLAACGGSDEFLEPGRIDLDNDRASRDSVGDPESEGAAPTAQIVLPSGAPSYCETLREMEAVGDDITNSDRAMGLYVDFLDGLVADGPEEYRKQLAAHAEDARKIQELGVDFLAVDQNNMAPEALQALLDFVDSGQKFDDLSEELLPVFREDCGDALADIMDVDGAMSSGGSGSPPSNTVDPDVLERFEDEQAANAFVPFTEELDGPFGSAEFSNTTFDIDAVVWSNRDPAQFLRPEFDGFSDDNDRRLLYVTINLINNDKNDAMLVRDEHLSLIVGDASPIGAVEASAGAGIGRDLAPSTAQVRTFGFEVGEVVDASTLTLRFADNAIPGFIDIAATGAAEASPYPLDVDPPAPGTYIGSNSVSCEVPWTWTVDSAMVGTDIAAEFDGIGRPFNARAAVGERWIRLTGTIATGDSAARSSNCSGNINDDDFRLVIDGLPFEPMGAPNTALSTNETIDVDLLWAIPADAKELAIRGLGKDGNSFDSAFTLPELPALRGE